MQLIPLCTPLARAASFAVDTVPRGNARGSRPMITGRGSAASPGRSIASTAK